MASGPSPYGPLQAADANGVMLPAGFTSRVVARTGQRVAGTSYLWHPAPLTGVDNVTRTSSGDLFVAEDGGNMEICLITPNGIVAPFLQVLGQGSSEITGPAFSPNGSRLYFSSQRGTAGNVFGGITYEVTGPFRG